MDLIRELDLVEIRVIGALLEKEQATPDHYPLTVNALLGACNQKSNRRPVTSLSETEIVEALDRLRRDVLVWRSEGARTEKWSQSISRRLELEATEKAILTLLFLRGPQTVGELRSRSTRLHSFDALGEVEEALRRLAAEERELVTELARRPGQKENRWAHLFGGRVEASMEAENVPPAALRPSRPALGERVDRLEEQVRELVERVEELRRLL